MPKLKIELKDALYLILGIAETRSEKLMDENRRDWLRIKDICEVVLGVESETAAEKLTGPDSSRE